MEDDNEEQVSISTRQILQTKFNTERLRLLFLNYYKGLSNHYKILIKTLDRNSNCAQEFNPLTFMLELIVLYVHNQVPLSTQHVYGLSIKYIISLYTCSRHFFFTQALLLTTTPFSLLLGILTCVLSHVPLVFSLVFTLCFYFLNLLNWQLVPCCSFFAD